MIDIYVLGFPRSGTSLMSHILTKMGCDFTHNNETIDDIYPTELNKNGYYQRKDLHLMLFNLGLNDFNFGKKIQKSTICTEFIKILQKIKSTSKLIAIKEPYLLHILPTILEFSDPFIILMIRNPKDVIKSCNTFLETINSDAVVTYEEWILYHVEFMKLSSTMRYIVIDYDDLIDNNDEICCMLLSLFPNLKIL